MEIRVFIVDDEQRAIEGLSNVLNTFFDNISIIGFASNVDSAFTQISSKKPDLVFLDIEMGPESGFQLLERFQTVNFHVVFLTAHEEFALKAIKFSALDYIIKPAEVKDLDHVINKVEAYPKGHFSDVKVQHMIGNFATHDKMDHKITIRVMDGYDFVRVGDIVYLKAEGSYAQIHLKSGDHLMTSKNLKFFEGILDVYGFFRIHNSTTINLNYIKKVNRTAGGSVVMEGGQEFSISHTRKKEFMDLLSLK